VPLTSVSNKVDGVAAWDKAVVDVNNVDESFANARDLGYSRLNNTRISVIGRLGKYDNKDTYHVQVLSNGKMMVNIRSEEKSDKVLDLSAHELKLAEIKLQNAAMGIKDEEDLIDTTPKTPLEIAQAKVKEIKEARNKESENLLHDAAEGMSIKVYMQKGRKTVLIGDSDAAKDSKEYTAMKEMLSGEYRAKKGNYYIEIGSTETLSEEKPYIMQIKQGKKYVNDYLVQEAKSPDSRNETISLTSSTSSSEQISSAYAAQIQAQKYQATASMMSDAYTNFSSMTTKKTATEKLLSTMNTLV